MKWLCKYNKELLCIEGKCSLLFYSLHKLNISTREEWEEARCALLITNVEWVFWSRNGLADKSWTEYDDEEEESDTEDENEEEDDDDYEDECEDNDYDLDAYLEWIKQHDHEFAAERIGVDLDACRDDEVNYTIFLSE